jgi:hypothetical protein
MGKNKVMKWDEELAKAAEIAAGMEEGSTGAGQFLSTKSGILSWQDESMPDNQVVVIIVDSILENVYYDTEWDADKPQPPCCFAFNRKEKELAPHKVVNELSQSQNETCEGCQWNEFGTADKGKGKACRNTRRLAMIPAGALDSNGDLTMIEKEKHYETASIGFMRLPVTSVKGYANYVTRLKDSLKRPPFGVVTRVYLEPDAKNQFKICFESLANVPDNLMTVIMARNQEVQKTIEFSYQLDFKETEKKKPLTAAKKKVDATKKKKKSGRKF